MHRLITGIVLIIIAVGVTSTISLGKFKSARVIQSEITRYDDTLDQSAELGNLRTALLERFEGIPAGDRDRLEKLLPRNIDTVRLTLEIDSIARQFGLDIKSLAFAETTPDDDGAPAPTGPGEDASLSQTSFGEYSSVRMSFSIEASHGNFIEFIKMLESNLRLSDVEVVSFSTSEDTPVNDYSVSFTTYWLGS